MRASYTLLVFFVYLQISQWRNKVYCLSSIYCLSILYLSTTLAKRAAAESHAIIRVQSEIRLSNWLCFAWQSSGLNRRG